MKGIKMFFKRKKLINKISRQLLEVADWNKRTFRDATRAGQLEKLEEELDEYRNSQNREEATKELADVFIVVGGLIRFNSRIGCYFQNTMFEHLKTASLERLSTAIEEKMEINRNRKWHKTGNGKYHH